MNNNRSLRPLLAAALAGVACLIGGPADASPSLDPFAPHATRSLSPFHVAQAEPAPAEDTAEAPTDRAAPATETSPSAEEAQAEAAPEGKAQAEEAPAAAAPGEKTPPPAQATSVTAPTQASSSDAATSCTRDDECPTNTICESGVCQAFERPIDVLLYRRDGRSTSFIPFYWSHRGNPGHRVVAPLYFHFWSPQAHTRILAPFYWRIEDYLKQRVVLVIPPYVQTSEPGARSWAFWPLFYSSTKFGWAVPPLLSFKVGDPDKGKAFGLWFLLYYWSRTPESKFDLLFPFAISTRSKDSAFTYAVPLNFYWRSGQDRSLLSIPFFYRNTTPTGGNFASLLGYQSIEGKATTGSFLWLYWFGRSKASSYDVLFPILWSFRSANANTTILPPLFHFRSHDSTVGTFALLGWWASNSKTGTSWQLAFPFYFHWSGDNGKKAFHLWPVGTYRRDDGEGSRYLTMLVPPIAHWRDKNGSVDFDILYYHHRDIPGDARTTVVGPYYQRTDPAGSTRALFPLAWYFHDRASGATAHSVLPFYFRRRSPSETMTAAGVFPLWGYYRKFADGGASGGLFPLAFFGHRKDKSHAIVFPFYWRFRESTASSTLLLPLYYAAHDKTSSSTHVFPLLYFSGSSNGDSYHIQFPLFWHIVDGRHHTRTTVTPIYFRNDDRDGYASGIFPLVYWGGGGVRRHFAIFPIFWWFRDDARDRTTTVIANYLHRREGGEITDALFPLFHYRRGAKPGGSDETSLTIFPLLHYRKDAGSTVFASPLAAWMRSTERQAGFVGPYFWYRDRNIAVRGVPLLYLDHTLLAKGERTRMWGPVVALDGPNHASRTVFPFWSSYWNQNERGTYVFPTFFRLRRNDGYQLDTLFPLVWHSRSPNAHTTIVGPYFTHHCPSDKSSGLVPFYVSTSSKKRDLTVTPLFVSHDNHETQAKHIVSWLYYESRQRENLFRVAFPLWWQSADKDGSTSVGFPLYWHFTNRKEDKSTTLLGPLYWARSGNERTRGLMPLAWFSRDAKSGAGSNAVMPLFYERHSPRGWTFLTLPFGMHRGTDRSWWYAGNFVTTDSPTRKFNTFFPLWFYNRDKVTETKTLVVPPFLHYSRTSPERSLSTWFLLFWHRSDVTSSSTFGLPLVYDFHAYHQSRLTMVLPVFFRYRNETSDESYTIAPLFYRRTSPVDSTTIGFPLYWRFWSPQRSTTVVFPVYFGVRRETSDTTFVFPNIYYRKGLGQAVGTSHLFVFPFWESEVKRPGDYMWEALLGLVGYERIGRNRFLKLLFIPFELEAAPAAKTAWYGKPAVRTKRERVARGLDIRSW
jgi:hypothetical protein